MKVLIATSIMIYFILLIILVLNIEDKSKIIKYSFLIFILILNAALFIVNEVVMDYIISFAIKYVYFPSFASVLLTLFITTFIFLYNIFKDNIDDKRRIINYIFSSFIFISYIIFMLLDVNINSFNSLYSGNSLICMRYISRTFILWMIVMFGFKYFRYFMKKR